jgi:XTP/dITP diphosphohydrolase
VSLAQERGWDAERALRVRIRGLEDEVRAVEASSASDDLEE